MRAYAHPMQSLNTSQQLGFFDDIKDWGQGLVDNYIDEPLRDLADSVGLSQEEVDRIASETNKAYQQELQNKQEELVKQITGATQQQPSTTQTTIANLQNQISNLTNQLEASVPGGMTTVYAVGGLLGGFVLYKLVSGPK